MEATQERYRINYLYSALWAQTEWRFAIGTFCGVTDRAPWKDELLTGESGTVEVSAPEVAGGNTAYIDWFKDRDRIKFFCRSIK